MLNRNDDNIQELIDSNTHAIVMFGASWCGPCKVFKPKFQSISEENEDIVFAYCDVDETSTLASELEVQSIPTVVSFFNGVEDATVVGPSVDRVKELVEKIRKRANS